MPVIRMQGVVARLDVASALLACVMVVAALVIIWVARLTIGQDVYVSMLGAQGMPTAQWFQVALVLVSLGGGLVAFAARGIRVPVRVLRAWRPAVSLGLAAGFFMLSSQVTCTPGCPVPYGPLFTWPDFVHTTSAVLAFGFACWGMLQLAFAPGRRMLGALSACSAVAVALVAAAGGILSLANWQIGLGSRLEFVATTIAIAWLVSLSVTLVLPPAPRVWWRPRMRQYRRPWPEPSRALSPAASSATAPQQPAGEPDPWAPR